MQNFDQVYFAEYQMRKILPTFNILYDVAKAVVCYLLNKHMSMFVMGSLMTLDNRTFRTNNSTKYMWSNSAFHILHSTNYSPHYPYLSGGPHSAGPHFTSVRYLVTLGGALLPETPITPDP